MLKRIVPLISVLALSGGIAAYAVSAQSTGRLDCPGQIVCPLSGELVCVDRCPLGDARVNTSNDVTALPACCKQSK